MSCKTKNNLPVELVCASSFALDVFGSGLFSVKEIYIVSTSGNPEIWWNNSKYVQVSSDIRSLLLADAIDNVDDNMTEVCIEAIAFLNKVKKETNRNIFFNTPFTWGSYVKIRNLNNSVPKHNGSDFISFI